MRVRSLTLSVLFKLVLVGCVVYVLVRAFQDPALGVSPLRFFTLQSNIAAAAACLFFAAREVAKSRLFEGRRDHQGPEVSLSRAQGLVRGVVLLAISITGFVFNLLLAQLLPRVDLANQLAHAVVPIGFVLDWLLFDVKGRFRYRDVLVWVAYPLLYFFGTLAVGAWGDGFYPYPFLNAAAYGYGAVARNAVVMLIAFSVLGELYVWVDRRMGRPASPRAKSSI